MGRGRRSPAGLILVSIGLATTAVFMAGCALPTARLDRIRPGMTKGDVRKIMGNPIRERWDEGIEGVEGGKVAWIYEEGEVRFFMQEVEKVLTTEELEKERKRKAETEGAAKRPRAYRRQGEPDRPYSLFDR